MTEGREDSGGGERWDLAGKSHKGELIYHGKLAAEESLIAGGVGPTWSDESIYERSKAYSILRRPLEGVVWLRRP